MKLELTTQDASVVRIALEARKIEITQMLSKYDLSLDLVMLYKKDLQIIDKLLTKLGA